MKMFNSFGPSPRTVRMFLLEKSLELPFEYVDTFSAENRQAAHLERNMSGQMPVLQISEATYLSETVAICEYLEELHPENPLIGRNAEERAVTRMTVRRVELNVTEFIYTGFKFGPGIDFFRERTLCFPEASAALVEKAHEGLRLIEKLLTGNDYLANGRFSLADIILFVCLDFMDSVGQPFDTDLPHVAAWKARIGARHSAEGSLFENWAAVGMKG